MHHATQRETFLSALAPLAAIALLAGIIALPFIAANASTVTRQSSGQANE